MDADSPTAEYRQIVKALKRVDVDFFHDLAVNNHRGFLWHVTLSYDKVKSLKTSLDFCGFPILKRIFEENLGHEERRYAKLHKRNVSKEPPKLCDLYFEGPTYLYTENLLFLLIHQSHKVTKVHQVCSFRHEQFLRNYLEYLQIQRGKSDLKIIASACKSLGNNLAGRFHQNLHNMSRCTIVTTKEQFRRHVNDPKFLNVHALSPTTAILTSQSLIVSRHTNIPSISSRIYQRSKFILLRGFFYLAAKLCAFSGNGGVRLAGSDTGRIKIPV